MKRGARWSFDARPLGKRSGPAEVAPRKTILYAPQPMRVSMNGFCMHLMAGVALAALSACAPAVGDSCSGSTDCSIDGSRICDTAQPGGYCTVMGCDPDTCPDGAVCVEWRYDPARTAETYCMKRCSSNGGCRDGYACEDPEAITDEDGDQLARIIDLRQSRRESDFCVAQ